MINSKTWNHMLQHQHPTYLSVKVGRPIEESSKVYIEHNCLIGWTFLSSLSGRLSSKCPWRSCRRKEDESPSLIRVYKSVLSTGRFQIWMAAAPLDKLTIAEKFVPVSNKHHILLVCLSYVSLTKVNTWRNIFGRRHIPKPPEINSIAAANHWFE